MSVYRISHIPHIQNMKNLFQFLHKHMPEIHMK